MGGVCNTCGGEERRIQGFLGSPLGRPRRRLEEDNIKMDLQEVGWRAWAGFVWLRRGTGGGDL